MDSFPAMAYARSGPLQDGWAEAGPAEAQLAPRAELTNLCQKFASSRPFIPICPSLTRAACSSPPCAKVHFLPLLRPHTDTRLGDCSYLNTCHRMESCRYIHWTLETPVVDEDKEEDALAKSLAEVQVAPAEPVWPAQWLNVDLSRFDPTVLGKFDVVVADPPWAIHQELPYGTLTDEELMAMPVGAMQDEGGLLFLWVTGRAMELGRDCLSAWGYERIDELIWVKTNQLQGLIRTGRTGHWLNHSKEHCLVALRKTTSNPPKVPDGVAKGLDTQVILAEVRETSRKPDELYQIIERLLGGKGKDKGRKVELFGREHNLREGWFTLGNQVCARTPGVPSLHGVVYEHEVVSRWNERYPGQRVELSVEES